MFEGARHAEPRWREGGLAFFLSHKLLCTCCWAVAHAGTGTNTHSQPVLQGLTLPSRTRDHLRASQDIRKLKGITYKLRKQFKSLTHETGEVQMKKKKPNPMNVRASSSACPCTRTLAFSHPEGCVPDSMP